MASYYVNPYTPPTDYKDRSAVRDLQTQLNALGANLKTDGIYGKNTDAAYRSLGSQLGGANSLYGSSATYSSFIPQDYMSILNEVRGMLQPSTMSYTGPSRAELEAGMRPSYDLAIEGRRKQTDTNKANIDVDAASRGMGSSTWTTDVKNRQQNAEASDIASLEAAYAQQLLAALQQESQNRMAVDQFNANAQAQALQAALGLTGDLYGHRLNQLQLMEQSSSSGGRRGSSAGSGSQILQNDLRVRPNGYAYTKVGDHWYSEGGLESAYKNNEIKPIKQSDGTYYWMTA